MIGLYLFFGGALVLAVTAMLYRREKTSRLAYGVTLACFVAMLVGMWMIVGG